MTKPFLKGVLKTWKEDRGFGFITPENGGRDVFIHISAIYGIGQRPVPGDIIHYQIARDRNGKFRAINARIEGAGAKNKPATQASKANTKAVILVGAVIALLAIVAGAFYFYFRSS